MMGTYAELMAFQRQTEALAQIAGRLGWDQETMMPSGAMHQRAEEMAAIESVLHARRADPRLGDWLATLADKAQDPVMAANLRLIRRKHDRATRVPAALAATLARETSIAQRVWADARANEDVVGFLPTLERIVALRREEAAALAGDGDAYDALLQDYEPGTSAAALTDMFGALRPHLIDLRHRVIDKARAAPVLTGAFDEAQQMALAAKVAGVFGYRQDMGRIDRAVHPFSSGSGQDVRITTRTVPSDPFNCIYSTIHEVGHAAYEQMIDPTHHLTPVGQGVSMGVHESQSRICENQLGRSRAFTGWLYAQMRARFGDFGIVSEKAFYQTVNRVSAGFIRTEADEVHYNLHVLLRFDLEQALISGDLQVRDLEAAWNDRFQADFGTPVDRPSHGCLQDVHWSLGLFGYFPTYTLGNVYAGCLHTALRAALPGLDDDLARGDPGPATAWLGENIRKFGGLYTPGELITRATGSPPDEGPLLAYLSDKFTTLFD